MNGRTDKRSVGGLCLAMAILSLLLVVGCGGDSSCVELGLKECDCCPAAQIDTCKQAIRAANDRDPPTSDGEKICDAALAQFSSCSQLQQSSLTILCSGSY